jgi:hypothetical protein
VLTFSNCPKVVYDIIDGAGYEKGFSSLVSEVSQALKGEHTTAVNRKFAEVFRQANIGSGELAEALRLHRKFSELNSKKARLSSSETIGPAPQSDLLHAAHTNDAARPITVNPLHRQLPSVGSFSRAKQEGTIADTAKDSREEEPARQRVL